MCITYVTSDYRGAEVTTNAKPAPSSNKEVNSIFGILRFQYEHTMAKQETIAQIFLG